MDENTEIIDNFESILKQQSAIRFPILYKSKTRDNNTKITENEKLNPQSVILSVAKQIKAIQKSETVKSVQKTATNMEKYKKSSFMPLNMLQDLRVPPHPPDPQKFDTQLISNTQLINIVEDAEAMDIDNGMTQEFETTFFHGHNKIDAPENSTHDTSFPILDISLKEPDPGIKAPQIYEDDEKFYDNIKCDKNPDSNSDLDTQVDDCTQILNECIEIEDSDDMNDETEDNTQEIYSQRPASPVFNVKSKKDTEVLVYNLETFENFEKIAMPIIEQTLDKEKARVLINSQIIGKELILQTYLEDTEPMSPIIELSNDLKIEKDLIPKNDKAISDKVIKEDKIDERNNLKDPEDVKSKGSSCSDKSILKDEILFSSDEEDEYNEHSFKDLPFTCALETSFYDHDEVLDKTMFVGFQTASNKSIQIDTEYFCKAKSLLDSVEEDLKNEATLTGIIEMCESNKETAETADVVGNVTNMVPTDMSMEVETDEQICHGIITTDITIPVEGVDSVKNKHTEKGKVESTDTLPDSGIKLEGFKTASNKTIQLSEKALERSKKVFQNIALDENLEPEMRISEKFEVKEEEHKLTTVSKASENVYSTKSNVDHEYTDEHKIGEDIIQEFQNDLMHAEIEDIFKHIEDPFETKKQEKYPPEIDGFRTASNKNIKISEAALAKSKHIFQDIDFAEKSATKANLSGECIISNKILNFGFKTASDKLIAVSKESLEKTKQAFDDFEMNEYITNPNKEKCFASNLQDLIDEPSASKKIETDVSKSQTAMKNNESQSKNESQASFVKPVNSSESNNFEFCGFKTASNKNIAISGDAMAKSKIIFNDVDNEPPFYGFEQNDKYIELVEETLEKSQKLFEKLTQSDSDGKKSVVSDFKNIRDSPHHNNENSASLGNHLKTSKNQIIKVGFKTASNKDIKISENALAKSRKTFQNLNEDTALEANDSPVINVSVSDLKFKGFKTASNKDIKISENALAKSRKMFQDINEDKSLGANDYPIINESVSDLKFKGFKTALNKEITISGHALARSRKMFQDISQDKVIGANDDLVGNKSVSGLKFKGFKTASNKEVKISEQALARSKKIFQEINDTKSMEVDNINMNTQFKGFESASNKEVKTSEETLLKNKKRFQDINEFNPIAVNEEKPDTKTQYISFQTASDKQVKISEEALAQSNNIFRDIAVESNADYLNTHTINTKFSSTFKGFQTASNKQVKISDAALAKSRKIFQDLAEDESEPNDQKINTAGQRNSTFKGFQTASNREVKISAEALARSKKLFQDINDVKNIEINTDNSATATFKGFLTASNKEVKISKEALAKSRKLFQDINDDNSIEMNQKINTDLSSTKTTTNAYSTFKGFQTANNKEVKVSEAALARSKKLFQDINDDNFIETDTHKMNTDPSSTSKFKGFQTASNKEVKISAEALASSRKIFQDIDSANSTTELNDMNMKVDSKFKGFLTGNNKSVEVSEQAITRSRKLFQDFDLRNERSMKSPENQTPTIIANNFESKYNDSDLKTINNNAHTLLKPKFAKNTDEDSKTKLKLQIEQKCSENFDDVDTQLLNNFEISMHETTPKKSKRSGSPILSLPKAKRRKVFQIPYSQKSPKRNTASEFKPPSTIEKPENVYKFNCTYKKSKKYTLKDLKTLEESSKGNDNIDSYPQELSFENLLQFEFTGPRNDISESVLTIPELKNIFLNSINKNLVPDGWLDIQLKLILWKLISYEIKYPKTMHLTCTVKNLIEQLKFRYDKELYNAERPALRKIFEKDDTSAKTLVLCVVAVYPAQESSLLPELLLTDGWYMIRAVVDKMLAKLIGSGKISVGTKLVTHGAEIVGSDQAVSPWEDTSSIRLKLFGNSTRRACWDARLGYHGNGAILSRLSHVAIDGGKISRLRVYVSRVYPALFVDKFEDGSTVTRSERLEHLHQMKFESERQSLLEKIYEDVEKEVLDQESQDSECVESGIKRKGLDSGSQIAKIMKRSRDPAEFRSHLTSTQTALLEDHTTKERERLLQEIQTRVQDKMAALGVTLNRNVVTLLKVRVAGVHEKNGKVEVTRALLSIWRPNEAVIEIIKEGTWIEIMNVVPTAMRYSELQLSAGRQSIFSQSKYKESEKIKPYTAALKRTCYPIKDLVRNPAITTDYNEIDTAGIVFEIDPKIEDFDPNKHQFQNVYLTDAEKNIISVNFWGGLKKFGFENVLDTGQVVACTNLQKRAGNSRKNIPQYRVTEFSYFTKTPKSDIARKIIEELNQELSNVDKRKFYQECVILRTNCSAKQQNNEKVTPYRFPNVDINASKHKIFIDSPIQNNNKKDENLNLTGLDFESTFKQDTQDLSPKRLLRKKQVEERIAKLKRYGEPPPLSPMQIINKSKKAGNAYKSPLMSKSDVSPSVAISEKMFLKEEENVRDVEIQCSPVMSLNRTYVKRSNPVKLNFSKIENSVNETVDEFGEEFDCSPPLSLD